MLTNLCICFSFILFEFFLPFFSQIGCSMWPWRCALCEKLFNRSFGSFAKEAGSNLVYEEEAEIVVEIKGRIV